MDGLEILKMIRANDLDVLSIAIAVPETVGTAKEALKHGAYEILTKPLLPEQLSLFVRHAFDRRALEEEVRLLRKERSCMQEEIALQRSRLKTTVNCMVNGVIVTDHCFNVLLYNPAVIKLLGLKEGPTGANLFDLLPEEKLRHHLAALTHEGAKPPESITHEIFVEPAEGSFFLRIHSATVKDKKGHIQGIVSVMQDISYLRDLERMKNDFISMVSHEIRTPVSAIQQLHTVLLKGIAGELTPRQRDMVSRAQARTEALVQLIKNLLDLTKIEAGRVLQRRENVLITDLFKGCIKELSRVAQRKEISIKLGIRGSIPTILADTQSIKGIIRHLLINALTFSSEGGSIRVTVGSRVGYVYFTIKDEGIGIAEDDLNKIFDRFYTVKSQKTRKIVGSGLGLPIVKGIVEAHLGHVEVESEPAKGTTFAVFLPVQT
jgi:PAS domain S-box-containing protein